MAKVEPQILETGGKGPPLGYAALTILFDGSGRNRVEWIFTSERTLKAWSVRDGRGERLDDRNLALKFDKTVLAVVLRGDEFLFIVNRPDGQPQEA